MKVYILKCSYGSYYTGVTSELEKRLKQHEEGAFPYCYTFDKRPIQLMFCREFDDNMKAIGFEKQVKGWSRAKKEALINGNIAKLKELSKSKKQLSPNASASSP
jgi:putative endonuclease